MHFHVDDQGCACCHIKNYLHRLDTSIEVLLERRWAQRNQTTLHGQHVNTAKLPTKYIEWRDKFVSPNVDILGGLEALSDVMLQTALREAIPGLAAEKLNPHVPERNGYFHLVTGMMMGIMRKRGINIPSAELHCPVTPPHHGRETGNWGHQPVVSFLSVPHR